VPALCLRKQEFFIVSKISVTIAAFSSTSLISMVIYVSETTVAQPEISRYSLTGMQPIPGSLSIFLKGFIKCVMSYKMKQLQPFNFQAHIIGKSETYKKKLLRDVCSASYISHSYTVNNIAAVATPRKCSFLFAVMNHNMLTLYLLHLFGNLFSGY